MRRFSTSYGPALRSALRPALIGALMWGLVSGPSAAAQDEAPAAAEAEQAAEPAGDPLAEFSDGAERATRELVQAVAKLDNEAAGQALAEHYARLPNLGVRLTAIEALGKFLDLDGAKLKVMSRLIGVAGAEKNRELRLAAIEQLGKGAAQGREGLEILVGSAVADELRVAAMRQHVAGASASDKDFYMGLWKRPEDDDKQKRRKDDDAEPEPRRLPQLRRLAFIALAAEFGTDELLDQSGDEDGKVRLAVLDQIGERGGEQALDLADAVLSENFEELENRLLAAKILIEASSEDAREDVLADIAKIAQRRETPLWLGERLAALYAEHVPDEVKDKLAKKFGKGKAQEKLFAIAVVGGLENDKVAKGLRKMIDDKEGVVRLAAIEAVGEAGDEEALESLMERLDPEAGRMELDAVLTAVSSIRAKDAGWLPELRELGKSESETLRNAALRTLVEREDGELIAVLGEALGHEDWSTRAVAIEGLAGLRSNEAIGLLVARMPEETGRLRTAIGERLFELSGKSYGGKSDSWTRWWADNAAEFEPISKSELNSLRAEQRARRLEESTTAGEFFGIEVDSTRVGFVVDLSGSMEVRMRGEYDTQDGERRIAVARRELEGFLTSLGPDAYFNLITFSDTIRQWSETLQRASPESVEEACEYIQGLNPAGGTNLFEGILKAFDDKDMDTLVVLSDGEPSMGLIIEPNTIRETIASLNKQRGVTIHTVQIGLELDILGWLAEDSGGTTVFIP